MFPNGILLQARQILLPPDLLISQRDMGLRRANFTNKDQREEGMDYLGCLHMIFHSGPLSASAAHIFSSLSFAAALSVDISLPFKALIRFSARWVLALLSAFLQSQSVYLYSLLVTSSCFPFYICLFFWNLMSLCEVLLLPLFY